MDPRRETMDSVRGWRRNPESEDRTAERALDMSFIGVGLEAGLEW